MRQRLIERVKVKEGFRNRPYLDTVGKLTIGYGRNLADVGLTAREAEYLLFNDLEKAFFQLRTTLPFWTALDEVRQDCLIEMAFNLGLAGLLKFSNMLMALAAQDYETAAREALDSKWARQVGRRADEIAQMMRTGQWLTG